MLPPPRSAQHATSLTNSTNQQKRQAVGWSLFSAAVVLVIIVLQQVVAGVASCARCWAAGAGAAMMAAQMALAVSLLLFRQRHPGGLLRAASGALGLSRPPSAAGDGAAAAAAPAPLPPPPPAKPAAGVAWRVRQAVGLNLPIILMYCPVHLFFTRELLAPARRG